MYSNSLNGINILQISASLLISLILKYVPNLLETYPSDVSGASEIKII